jgi:class 3 adenylate cyclase
MGIPRPDNEALRVQALASYRVLDTPPEFAYDALTELAAAVCDCPVAVIGLIDETRDWLKAKYGLPADFTECPRDMVVCSTTICGNDLIYVPDLTADERFRDYDMVKGEPYLRFYCGMPLINTDGYALGTLCVIDFKPHELTPSQRESVRRLAQQTMAQLELRRQLQQRDALLHDLSEARAAVTAEMEKSDRLLRSILPAAIAEELKQHQRVQPRFFESVTILFADFKGFTRLTEGLEPARLVHQLDQNFARFDEICEQERLETLKIIGDAYMCAGGLPDGNRSHPVDACLAALQMQQFIRRTNNQREKLHLPPWELRIGVNTGPVVAGVVGKRHFTYDIWGNAVNVAERLEAACEPSRINVSSSTLYHVGALFETEPRGSVEVKHKGAIDMYFLNRIKPELSADADGCLPNAPFWSVAAQHGLQRQG